MMIIIVPSLYFVEDFHCAVTQKCIPKSWVCDGDNDCGENEDEQPGCNSKDDFIHIYCK